MRKFMIPLIMLFITLFPAPAEEVDDFDSVFPALATQLSAVEGKLPKKTVAAYGFEVIGRPGDSYALYATEKLTHELVKLGKLLVIERSRLDEVLKEQNFSLSGAVDAATAARIGKLLSVDAVVTGTILITPDRTEFIARAVQSDTGIILASADVYVFSDGKKNKDKSAPGEDKTEAQLKPSKTRYQAAEKISITYSGFSGNENDWITLVKAEEPDTSYGEWFYTEGKESGAYTFAAVAPGEYEIRVYFDWPAGGYDVQKRVKITVK